MLSLAISESHISIQLLDSASLIKPSVLISHWGLLELEFVFNIRTICDSETQMCHKMKGQYVTTYLWPWHHKKPKSLMISIQKWPCCIRWTELRCLSDTIVICLGIVTRFGNCTNVWLWTNAKCCCFFLCVCVRACVLLLFLFFIKNKSMLIWPFAL